MSSLLVYITSRGEDTATVEVVQENGAPGGSYRVFEVIDDEPADVVGPILQRTVEAAGFQFTVEDYAEEPVLTSVGVAAYTIQIPEEG